jgi:sugar/nucleoside kinase (ribokinase family)
LLGRSFDEVSEFATRVKIARSLLAIDPGSYGFIEDHGVDSFRDLMKLADICFPNLEEQELLGLDTSNQLVVITSGHQGAKATIGSGQILEVEAAESKLIDPTGAGDAFCGGFIARLVQESDFAELGSACIQRALQAGAASGAEAVATMGARPSKGSSES